MNCAACMKEILTASNKEYREFDCKHIFHRKCVKNNKSSVEQSLCPNCCTKDGERDDATVQGKKNPSHICKQFRVIAASIPILALLLFLWFQFGDLFGAAVRPVPK